MSLEREPRVMPYRFEVKGGEKEQETGSSVRFKAKGVPVTLLVSRTSGSDLLKFPRWVKPDSATHAAFRHGSDATMQVDAPGLDGRTVCFTVERFEGGAWKGFDTVHAEVRKGVAAAKIQARHEDATHARSAKLRFRCEVT